MPRRKFEWHKVDSSNLNRVAWLDNRLYVEFQSGGIYVYSDVPEVVFEELMNADSAGSFFHAHIRKEYEYAKL